MWFLFVLALASWAQCESRKVKYPWELLSSGDDGSPSSPRSERLSPASAPRCVLLVVPDRRQSSVTCHPLAARPASRPAPCFLYPLPARRRVALLGRTHASVDGEVSPGWCGRVGVSRQR